MKFFLCTLLLIVLEFCLLPGTGLGQVFQHIADKEGAPTGAVYASAQDQLGFMWFGSTSGLFKYDTRTFKRFRHNPTDSTSLASEYVTALFCDAKGAVWICTLNGLCRYDSKSESFRTFKPIERDAGSISTDAVTCIAEDNQKNLWIGTKKGLNRVEIKNGETRFKRFLQARTGESDYDVQAITTGKKGELWLATTNGLVCFDNGNFKIFKADPNPKLRAVNHFTYIFNDHAGHIWLGIKRGGLMRFHIASQSFQHIENFKDKIGDWPDLSGFAADKAGKVWIATFSGLVHFDMKTLRSQWHVNIPANEHSLVEDALMSVFRDRQGGLWIGSYNSGLDYLNLSSPVFSRWPFFIERVAQPDFCNTWMGITPKQNLWLMSNDKSRLLLYDRVNNKTTSHHLSRVKDFSHFFMDENDVLWFGQERLLTRYDFKNGLRKDYPTPLLKDTPAGRSTIKLVHGKQNRIWLYGSFGLLWFDQNTTTFHNSGIETTVFKVLEDSKGNIWATGSNEVWFVRGGTKSPERIVVYKSVPPEEHSFLNLYSIAEDPAGRIWLPTRQGLRLYDPVHQEFPFFPKNQGTRFWDITDIETDRAGFLWLSKRWWLLRFHPDKSTLQSYSHSDGLPRKAAMGPTSVQKDDRGMLYFNTSKEAFSLDPDQVTTNNRPETIVVSSLRLFSKYVEANDETGILDEHISHAKALVFRHDQNIFTLDFAVLNYARSQENKYKYRLDGFEEKWNQVSVPSVTYMNLPPGKYTFVVHAANGDGLWMKEPLKLAIEVLPPWWKTWYAYLFYILLTTSIVYTVTRFFWIRSSFRKESALNQLKLDFFTNVSHEIRTHLSLISGPLEKVFQESTDDKNIRNYLTYARNSSDRLMLLVNELLDFRKIQNGSSRLQVQEHDVVKTIRSVMAAFEHTATEKDMETALLCRDEPVLLWFDIAQMQKVFYNLLSNAYKFTPDGGRITVSVTEISNEVKITVEDNGKGMSEEHLRKLFTYFYQADAEKPGYGIGLALSKSIVEQHRGYLTAESKLADAHSKSGTTLTIRMLRENRHFSADQFSPKSNYSGTALLETVALPTHDSVVHTKQSNTILIIEDNDELRAFIKELFEAEFRTLEAENGLRGLALANEHIPDVILCDVMMPGMNGLEVCNSLKNTLCTAHIPVVLLTARTQNEQIIEGLTSGADDYLIKPFNPKILELKINKLIRLRDDLKERYRRAAFLDQDNGGSIARDQNDAFTLKLKTLITENISDPDFGVNELAIQVGMSVSVLYRKMRSLTGMTVNEFVKAVRLNEAKKLLESGVYHVNEVAITVGFEDAKYFSKEFRKVFGKTPNELKKQSPN